MRKYGYLVVEGQHDVEFVYRLLSPYGLSRIQYEKDLDHSFLPLIPRQYPPNGDLHKSMSIPLFLQSKTFAIAVHNAGGDSRLVAMIEENAAILDLNAITGIGILLDSDRMIPAAQRYADIKERLAKINYLLDEVPGVITESKPKIGAFVLPDNVSDGTLEDLLLDSAKQVYPALLASAETHVNGALQNAELTSDDLNDLKKPAGRNKAIMGTMSNILRPGKAIQVSIQDNRWLRGNALSIPRIKAVQEFLRNLFELP
ncbi:MAG: DUF3226 domain-containing protein [Candidatus Methylumidiphilus sp.]